MPIPESQESGTGEDSRQPDVSASVVEFLSDACNYPDAPSSIDITETHFAWLFQTGKHVYKLKKPVKSNSLDLTTLTARQRNCELEDRLNRRLTTDVYLGVIPLTRDAPGKLHLNGTGQPIEWLVKMRQLPANRMLDHAIRHGTVVSEDANRIVKRLISFYDSTPVSNLTANQFKHKLEMQITHYEGELSRPEFGMDSEYVAKLAERQLDFLEKHSSLFAQRIATEKVREVHGDLKPEHICLGPEVQIIDCLEFDAGLRTMDCLEEIAFLAMECQRLGAPWFGAELLEKFQTASDDRPDIDLVKYYLVDRAAIRAMLAIWHVRDSETDKINHWKRVAQQYLESAARFQAGSSPLLKQD